MLKILTNAIALSFLLFLNPAVAVVTKYDDSKLYIGMGAGTQLINKTKLQTVIPDIQFIQNDQFDLAIQVISGYELYKFLSVEGGVTFFPGFGYKITPNRDTISRKIYTASFVAKLVAPIKRFSFFLAFGPAVVYTDAENFEVYAPMNESLYIDAKWGSDVLFRPKFVTGIGFYVTKRINLGLSFLRIFGQGAFINSTVAYPHKDNEFYVSKGYLPNLDLFEFVVTIKV